MEHAETGGVGVLSFEAADDTVVSGAEVSLSWRVANASSVAVEASGGTVVGLDACTEVDAMGEGGCQVEVQADTLTGPVPVTFTLTAIDAQGQTSAPATLTVRVGRAPELTASVTPDTLPDGGGSTELAWSVTNRDGVTLRVVVAPESDPSSPLVDTNSGIGDCDGQPCQAAGDSLTLFVTTTTRWIVRASNEFGGQEVVVGATVVGTPTITAMRVEGTDVFDPSGAVVPVVVDGETASFEWETVRATETMLEFADSADCTNPALAWTGVEFSKGAPSGIHTLGGITSSVRCYRLTARETVQGQFDRAVFQVVRRPVVETFSISDATLAPGGQADLTWTTRFASSVSITSLPAGVDTSACTAANGSCTITVPSGISGFLRLFVIAHNSFTDSMNRSVTIDVQPAPTLSFSAVDATDGDGELPAAGGDVRLSWTAGGADSLRITDEDGTVVLDTALPTSIAPCPGGSDATVCEVGADALVYSVGANTTWTAVARNAYGQASATARVTVAGAPTITTLTVDGQNVLGLPGVVVEADDVTFQWTTSSATSTRLERGAVPPAGCVVGNVTWGDYLGFPGTPSGGFVAGTHVQDWCYRFTASDTGGSDVHVFRVSRRPEVVGFSVADATVAAGRSVTFTWDLRFADAVEIVSATGPSGDATADFDFSGCTAVDGMGQGGCTVDIPAGEPLGTYDFELVAAGPSGARSTPAFVGVEIGEAPVVASFTATPSLLPSGGGSVQLDWTGVSLADGLEVLRDEMVVYSEATPAASGSLAPDPVSTKTLFSLVARNVYADTRLDVVVYLQPTIDRFEVDGQAATGAVVRPTGDMLLLWETTEADEGVLEEAAWMGPGQCGSYAPVYTGAPDDQKALNGVVRNACYRLVARNGATQTLQSFELLERPDVGPVVTDVSSVDGNDPGPVTVTSSVSGVRASVDGLQVVARYYDASGDPVTNWRGEPIYDVICTESDFTDMQLDGDPAPDPITCVHDAGARDCGFLGCSCSRPRVGDGSECIPESAAIIRYVVTGTDAEGDSHSASTAGGQDVTVN